ncbi:hypothetical protein EPR50_G00195960 [Perca flavescens]|uniref:Ig-like domain-containing protein n=1 Tax=Perca flavescens TaxID=8167 RepID=A0A484C762_PERFV|nr:hypothetical protein EPR50_G00195960 [Perca flavescens]
MFGLLSHFPAIIFFFLYSSLQSLIDQKKETDVVPLPTEMAGGLLRCLSCLLAYSVLLRIGLCLHETNRAVVTLQPNWPKIYRGETISLICEIQNGGDTKWEYEWTTTSSKKPDKKEYTFKAFIHHSGSYRCKGKNKDQLSSTEWSDALQLTVYQSTPEPVLTVSPLWLNPEDSVTLNCKVEHPSAGWRFYWYKDVPKLKSQTTYIRELLPGLDSGSENDSYIVRGQPHTAAYYCTATRGSPAYNSQKSKRRFVWSRDFNSAASLTVTPDRVQHLFESVSLRCEGKSTQWRVMMFTATDQLSRCYGWGIMNGSTCNIERLLYSDSVYWCESGSGDFSNAVNISVHLYRPESKSSLLALFTAVTTGAFIILLLLVYHFKKSKGPCGDRTPQSQSTNQDAQVNEETQEHVYASPLPGEDCIYESISGCKDNGNDEQAEEYNYATFNSIELKVDKRTDPADPVENSIYYNVNQR